MPATNIYRTTAHLYDLDPRPICKDDIRFYLDLAERLGGPVLELGCGTGRVSIALAAAGTEVWGIDLSEDMLERLRVKLSSMGDDVGKRVFAVHGDMTAFRCDQKFPLAIIPFRSLQALPDTGAMSKCLQCVAQHLMPGGRLVIHLFRPYGKLDQSWLEPAKLDWEVVNPETNERVKRFQVRRSIDVEKQSLRVDLEYRVTNSANEEQSFVEPLSISYLYEEQVRELVSANGFVVEEEYGYFDKRALEEGSEIIFVLRHER